VLDASALLTLLFREPGAAAVDHVIAQGAAVSTVNLSEVAAVLVRH
jgi:PIN domain nuclease of toxin-antitoxin system